MTLARGAGGTPSQPSWRYSLARLGSRKRPDR